MLTGDLVRARVQKNLLSPSFIKPASKPLRTKASELVEVFHAGVEQEWTRAELDEAIHGVVADDRSHKTLRGLAKLLSDRSTFDTESPVDPVELRRTVFAVAREVGPLALERSVFERPVADDVFASVAEQLGITAEQVSRSLYADLKENQRILTCTVPDGEWLLHRYNVALVQALLLKATEVRILLDKPSVPRLRQLLRYIKFHQLLHRVEPVGSNQLRIVLDGPTSLFTQSTRYGMQLANFFPGLLLQDEAWTLEATVLWTRARHRKTLTLSSSDALRSHYTDTGAYETKEQKWFVERFAKLKTPWKLRPCLKPVVLGTEAVMLPDFTLEHEGRVAHLEIVGFWRRDYLERRVELLKKHGPGNLILAVSRKLRASKEKLGDFDGEVIDFSEIIPPKTVIEAAERIAR